MPEVSCKFFPSCRGCDHWGIDSIEQKNNKVRRLKDLLQASDEILSSQNFVSVKPYGLRHRFDFTIESRGKKQSMGFYGAEKNLIDIDQCLQLSPELQKVFTEFRFLSANKMQTAQGLIQKASVRLRVSPDGDKGCWLDMANVDIKALLDDSTYLNQLLQAGFEVEIGQKGKKLSLVQGRLKLTDPLPKPWFRTGPYKLKSLISDFTQPSWITANALTEVMLSWTKNLSLQKALEFGPGVGQFTLPLLAQGISVLAFENNPKAIEVLQQNARENGLEKKLTLFAGDFQNKPADIKENIDLVLVNPPRSGLKRFVDTVVNTQAKYCIYISCFPESMQMDLEKIQQAGYKIKSVQIVDQFPQTEHFESCVLLESSQF